MTSFHVSAAAGLGWLLTFFAYSSLVLGAAWLTERFVLRGGRELPEIVWRIVVIVALAAAIPTPLRHGLTISVPDVATPGEESADTNAAIAASAVPTRTSTRPSTMPTVMERAKSGPGTRTEPAASGSRKASARTSAPAASGGVHGTRVTSSADLREMRAAPPLTLAATVATLWLGLAAAWLIKLAWDHRRAVQVFGPRVALRTDHRACDLLRGLCAAAGVDWVPRLTTSTSLVSPVSLIGNEICIPDWALDDLDDAQLEGLLAHELAHQRRGDPWIFLALQILERMLWVQPLFRVAHARLRALAELSADDWARARTRNGQAIASTLYACVARSRNAPLWGVAIVTRRSAIVQRVQRLLAAPTERRSLGRAASVTLTCAAIAIALALPTFGPASADESAARTRQIRVPAPAAAPAPVAAGSPAAHASAPAAPAIPAAPASAAVDAQDVRVAERHVSIHQESDGDRNELQYSADGRTLSARWDGEFALNDDETDVARLDPGASLEIEARDGRDKRRITFAERDGTIVRKYFVDDQERPLDDAGRAWLASTLKEMLRATGLNASERVAKFLARGGPDAVLAEMDDLIGSYTLRIYSEELIGRSDLTDAQVRTLCKRLARDDEGDYDLRTVLMAFFEHKRVSPAVLPDVVAVAKKISSDYDRRLVLEAIAGEPMTAPVLDAWIDLAGAIESDYDQREAIVGALGNASVDGSAAGRLLDVAAKSIDADYDLSQVILATAQLGKSEVATAAAIRALSAIGSDYDRRVALEHIVEAGKLDANNWRDIIAAAQTIGSDYDRAEALTRIAASMPADDATAAAYRRASESIGSEYDRQRALDAQGARSRL